MIFREAPNYHRQRFLLFLLEQMGNIALTDFQQLLFLSQQELLISYYDSVYCETGFHSFQALSDLEVLEQKGWVVLTKDSVFLKDKPYLGIGIKKEDRWIIAKWFKNYKGVVGESLIKLVNDRYAKISLQNFNHTKNDVFTIGYEGLSLERYLTKLIQNKVDILYDLRRNPLSRKFGFSKGMLSETLPKFGIEYRHIPELGIVSQKRQNLNNDSDYSALFDEYRESLPNKIIYIQKLIVPINEGKRIALTCFEVEHQSCHRHCVSEYLSKHISVGVAHL